MAGMILVLGDTTQFTYKREPFDLISATKVIKARVLGRTVNATRVPVDTKESLCWLDKVRQTTELLTHPDRCVHIADRGGDIYALFCLACETRTHFLNCTCVDRLAGDAGHPALVAGYACEFYSPPPLMLAWTVSKCCRIASAAASGSRCLSAS